VSEEAIASGLHSQRERETESETERERAKRESLNVMAIQACEAEHTVVRLFVV
jgi:hypothetical protein